MKAEGFGVWSNDDIKIMTVLEYSNVHDIPGCEDVNINVFLKDL